MEVSENKRKFRKYKDKLATAGYGVVIFILWGIIKELFYLKWYFPNNEEIADKGYLIGFSIFSLVLLGICLATGILARKYGRSDYKEKTIFIVFSFILGFLVIASLFFDIALLFTVLDDFDVLAFITLIADVSFFVFVLQILISIFLLKNVYKTDNKEVTNER